MKITLTIITVCIVVICFANMASPYERGTKSFAPVTSRNINITRELLMITPAKDFETASFSIDYFINTDTAGLQVPLLFVAADYADSMAISLDGATIQHQNFHLSNVLDTSILPLHNFDSQFDIVNGQRKVKITWGNGAESYYDLAELQYFKADMAKGKHTIHVQYTAKTEIDRSGWIRNYSCNYYLSPAKHWKAFGNLDVLLDKRNFAKPLTTNLNKPAEDAGTITRWHFTNLPEDVLQISYKPQPSSLAAALISISPMGLAVIAGIVLMTLQVWLMLKYRYSKSAYRLVYYLGTFAIPVIFYVCYFSAYGLIDAVIGDEAARFHGYIFLFGFTYVLVAPGYAGILYLASNGIKHKALLKPTSAAT